jgi:hypothetical protein
MDRSPTAFVTEPRGPTVFLGYAVVSGGPSAAVRSHAHAITALCKIYDGFAGVPVSGRRGSPACVAAAFGQRVVAVPRDVA